MSFKLQTKYVLLVALALIIATFVGGWYVGHKKADNAATSQRDALNAIIIRYQKEINGKNTYITEKQQEITTLKNAIIKGDIEKAELRILKIKQLNEISRLNLQIDTLLENVGHNGEVIEVLNSRITNYITAKDSNISQKAILLPFTFDKSDKWLKLQGVFNKEGKLDINLRMSASVDVWTGIKKKTKEPFCMVTTDNPYMNVIDIKSQKFDLPKIKKWGIGIYAGYGLSIQKDPQLVPYIGVGVSRNIIRF